ncbi:hypothetical protein C0J52_15197 [Blattella germanica]|nr:hypothetical protein C0J52_15197 [Blattella germanica]
MSVSKRKEFKIFLLIAIVLKCSSANLSTVCKKEAADDMKLYFSCECTKDIQDLLFDDHLFFSNAVDVTISNCASVDLIANSLESDNLEILRLRNIDKLFIDIILNFQFKALALENIGLIEELSRGIFLRVTNMSLLYVRNTHVKLLSESTFQDTHIKNATFINVTIDKVGKSSLNFTVDEKDFKKSVVLFEQCRFGEMDVNAISAEGIETTTIVSSEFKTFSKSTLSVTSPNFMFDNNILPCKSDRSCSGVVPDIVKSLHRNSGPSNICAIAQTNYCNQNRKQTLLDSVKMLEKCNLNFTKWGIDTRCLSFSKVFANSAERKLTLSFTGYAVFFIIFELLFYIANCHV